MYAEVCSTEVAVRHGRPTSLSMKRYAILALVSLLLVACATSPTGRRQLMLVSEESAISASKEAYAQTLKPLSEEGKVDTDPVVKQRVTTITERLVAQAVKMRPATARWEWSIKVIDDPEVVNAWCMAGGKMAIYTGLIDKLDATDDEIAQVMGHEISHALANHQAEKMSVAMASSVGVIAVGAASDRPGGGAGRCAGNQAAQQPYCRNRGGPYRYRTGCQGGLRSARRGDTVAENGEGGRRPDAPVPEHPSRTPEPSADPERTGAADDALLPEQTTPTDVQAGVTTRPSAPLFRYSRCVSRVATASRVANTTWAPRATGPPCSRPAVCYGAPATAVDV